MARSADNKLLAEWFWTDRWTGSSAFMLPLDARGLYREMLTQAWRRAGRLPKDHESIRRAVGCTEKEWRTCWPKIERYWKVDGDYLVNETQLEVYQECVAAQQRASERGRRGAMARAEARAQATAQATAQGGAQATAQATPKHSLEIKPPDPALNNPRLKTTGGDQRAHARAPLTAGLKEHAKHRSCGVVCLHASQYDAFLRQYGGDDKALDAWVAAVLDEWQRRVDAGERVPEGDSFDFWRNRYTEAHGGANGGKPARQAHRVAGSTLSQAAVDKYAGVAQGDGDHEVEVPA